MRGNSFVLRGDAEKTFENACKAIEERLENGETYTSSASWLDWMLGAKRTQSKPKTK